MTAWFTCLPSCETEVPCGAGRHVVRWEAGSLRLPSHPDAEGELVLAALGGAKARCIELAEAWARHADDLSMLAIGPRGPADEIAVGWDDVIAAAQAGQAPGGPAQTRPMRLASHTRPTMARVAARQRQMQEEVQAFVELVQKELLARTGEDRERLQNALVRVAPRHLIRSRAPRS